MERPRPHDLCTHYSLVCNRLPHHIPLLTRYQSGRVKSSSQRRPCLHSCLSISPTRSATVSSLSSTGHPSSLCSTGHTTAHSNQLELCVTNPRSSLFSACTRDSRLCRSCTFPNTCSPSYMRRHLRTTHPACPLLQFSCTSQDGSLNSPGME